jgi:hypothetical protein
VPRLEPRTSNLEPRTSNLDPEPRTGTRTLNPEPGTGNLYTRVVSATYLRVILLETAIIIALVVLGRLFA